MLGGVIVSGVLSLSRLLYQRLTRTAVHIHLVDFQIIKRVALGPTGRDYLTEYERFAMKDIAAVGSEEEVHILAKYAPWDGLYMFHCHNLAHEDDNMV